MFEGAAIAPPSTTTTRAKGELVFDANAGLWICVAAGTPGTWRQISGPATAGASTILPSTFRIDSTTAHRATPAAARPDPPSGQ